MMHDEAFGATEALLLERGLVIDESRYDRQRFGSWFIYVGTSPRLGLVWDGRDGWLYVRREAGHQWEDLWIGREAHEQSPAVAADTLFAFAVQQGSVSGPGASA